MPVNQLIAGFKSFRQNYFEGHPEIYRDLVQQGQHPEVMVIACADSRVNPSLITQAGPGELFVVRNVANLVAPYEPDGGRHGTSAAIEFAVRDLGVSEIVVLGHTHCGGIRRLCDGGAPGSDRDFIDQWMAVAKAARAAEGEEEDYYRSAERRSVTISVANLMTYPWVREKVDAGHLHIHGWIFDIQSGELFGHGEGDAWISLTG